MKDPRFGKLAAVLLHHSIKIQPGEKVLIEAFDIPEEFVQVLIDEAARAGALPFLWVKQNRSNRALLMNAAADQLKLIGEMELAWMKQMDAYIGIRGGHNVNELSDVPQEKMRLYQDWVLKPVHFQQRVNHTRWVVLRYPSPSFAQQAGMSSEAFEDFFFDVCAMDYQRMDRAMQPLKQLMEKTDRVHIVGPDTDLHFSIKGIPVIGCAGTHNIPDGEVFTAPVKNSVNGRIRFNTPTLYQGTTFTDVCLHFENGRIVKAGADKTDKLNEILDTDEGARYIGEFSLAFNPYVTRPMLDILFDEKISGSFHFTPGQAYEDADNGNRSNIHWDMVMRQDAASGGGEIYFDERLVRRDGIFLPDELAGLNPENLR